MPTVQQSEIIQSQKAPYMLTMPNISREMHPYSMAEWGRRGPSLFDDDEAKLQYLTMISNRDGTLLSAQAGLDDGDQGGGIVKEEESRQARHHREAGPDRRQGRKKKKISLAEYNSKKKVSSSDGPWRSAEPEGAGVRSTKDNNEMLTSATCYSYYKDDEARRASPTNCQEGYIIGSKKLLVADKTTPERARHCCGVLLSASVGPKFSTAGANDGTQEKEESSGKKRSQKRRIEAIIEPPEDAGKPRQESGSLPAKKVRASPKLTSTAQEQVVTNSSVQGDTVRDDKNPSGTSARHNSPSEPKNGSDAVSVPIIKQPPMTIMRAAILPLPPTKGTTVRRQSMRGVAFTKKARALSEPSAPRPHLSTILAADAAQGQGPPPSWLCHEHLEWIEQEVARRVAAALAIALSKDENANAPAASASAGAPNEYKDAGTQVDDAVIPTARASGAAGDDCVLIEKKKKKIQTTVNKPSNKPVLKGAGKELPTMSASEQTAVQSSLERKAAKKSAEQEAMQHEHVDEETTRNGRPLQQLKNQNQHHHQLKSKSDKGRPQQQSKMNQNQNSLSVDPKPAPASKKVKKNTAPAPAPAATETESRAGASAAASKAIINPIKKNQASKPAAAASKKIDPRPGRRPLVPNWFQMLQPPQPNKKQS